MAKVRLNRGGMRELLSSPGLVADLAARGARVAAAAQSSAPVESGTYQASIHVETVQHPSRTVAQVVADVDYAMTVEANTGNLLRALDAAR